MYVRFDYKCPKCGYTEDRFIKKDEMDRQTCDQLTEKGGSFPCAGLMVRMPSAPPTTFTHADPSATKKGVKK
jgi:hypothetical protein